MTDRTFAPWVEPYAAKLRQSRGEIVDVAREIPADAWEMPSPNEGWTYRQLLGHLAVGDWVCQSILRAVVSGEPADLAMLAEVDERNERYRQERENRSIEELILEVEAEGEETQELFARLTEADEDRRQADAPMSLGEYLGIFPSHDQEHLAQIRGALEHGS